MGTTKWRWGQFAPGRKEEFGTSANKAQNANERDRGGERKEREGLITDDGDQRPSTSNDADLGPSFLPSFLPPLAAAIMAERAEGRRAGKIEGLD